MTIYLDVIWLLNFFFDALLLLLTAIILKRKINKWRLFIGAFLGSLIVLFYFTPFQSISTHPVMKLLYSILIVYTAFGFQKFRSFLKNLLTFYFITFMVGGGMLGLHYFFQTDIQLINGIVASKSSGFGDPVSWITVVIGFPLVWYFSKHNMEEIEVQKIHYDQLVRVQIKLTSEEHSFQLTGLIDSGNQLHDPITQTPVMILDLQKASSFIPEYLMKQAQHPEALEFDTMDSEWSKRIRIVPYRGVGHDHQFLLAVRPYEVTIHTDEEEFAVKKVLIGLSHTNLSSNGDYACILHPRMLTNNKHQSA